MSDKAATPHAGAHGDIHHGAAHHHDHHGDGAAHGSMQGYVIGFALAVVLTAIPFILVMTNVFSDSRVTAFLVMGLAIVQIVVHMVCFLHMNTKSEGGWNMLALIFTMVLVIITLAGSLWVMYHLNTNMMQMPHDMREMP